MKLTGKYLLFIMMVVGAFSFIWNSILVIPSNEDGPYIFHGSKKASIMIMDGMSDIDTLTIGKEELYNANFLCKFDGADIKPLQFQLRRKHQVPPEKYDMPTRMFVLSDIEGNFEAYYNLLVANKVIDKDYNWIFGDGHLIHIGDMVDRGEYVTQCLWLTYHLEQEAAKHGGRVSFILGNHEQLVLLGNKDYAADKYKELYQRLQTIPSKLYSDRTELGRWLRSKNSIIKVGDYIFVHAGISPEMLKYGLNITQMNRLVRRKIDKYIFDSEEEKALLYNDGILWYRGLVESNGNYEKIEEGQLNTILKTYGAKTIVVGHTPVGSVSEDFGGKVIRTDVSHYDNSSALYFENGVKYVVDAKGNRILLSGAQKS